MRLGSLEQCYLSKDGILYPWDVEGPLSIILIQLLFQTWYAT